VDEVAATVAAAPASQAFVESSWDLQDRKMAEVAALLELGSRCEESDPARAAVAYSDAVVGCLEADDDPLGSDAVRRGLLRGFDRLSFVLERQDLPDEALAVIDDAASLGLLDGADEDASELRGSLRARRESLRRTLSGDSPPG
jgi:hypothetical protein